MRSDPAQSEVSPGSGVPGGPSGGARQVPHDSPGETPEPSTSSVAGVASPQSAGPQGGPGAGEGETNFTLIISGSDLHVEFNPQPGIDWDNPAVEHELGLQLLQYLDSRFGILGGTVTRGDGEVVDLPPRS